MTSLLNPPPRNLVLAFVEDHPKAIVLLLTARKRALENGGKWRAVFVETPVAGRHDDSRSERMLRLLTQAEQMGGETEHLEAANFERGMRAVLDREALRLSLVIIGSVEFTGRFSRWRMLPWMRAVRVAGQRAQVEIVPLSGHAPQQNWLDRLHVRSLRPGYFASAVSAVAAAWLFAYMLQWVLPPALFRVNDQNVGLVFMIACAFTAGRYGLLPGLFASIVSFFAVNYYYTVPYQTLKLTSVTDILNMALFLSAALLVSLFTSQTRDYAEKTAKRELSTQVLFTLYRIASEAFSRQQALEKLQRKLERMLEVDVAFFLPPALNPDGIEASYPEGLRLSEADQRALNVCWSDMKTTGVASPYNPGATWRFEPMISAGGEIGVLGIRPRKRTTMDAWFGRLFTAIADQTATILEHIELERSMEATRIREEREKLRSMLLSSVSHDLKTPLAGIIGALSVHNSLGSRLSQEKRDELIESSLEEAQRLDSFITNILDMTRLESGNIRFKQEWRSVDAMIDNVSKRMQHRLRGRKLSVYPFPTEIEAYYDVVMTEQVLQNLIDNACKYTPDNSTIDIQCHVDPDVGFTCSVRDHGEGLPPDRIQHVFDKYARLHKKDAQIAGTGLGLAISKAVIEAQGGWIRAANHPEGGAVFTFCLPQWRNITGLKLVGGSVCN